MYCDNKELYTHIHAWLSKKEVLNSDIDSLAMKRVLNKQMPDVVSKAIVDIANKAINQRRFYGWSIGSGYRSDMISFAILTCLERIHTYDINKQNPMAYITSICNNAYQEFMNKETKERHGKNLAIVEHMFASDTSEFGPEAEEFLQNSGVGSNEGDCITKTIQTDFLTRIHEFEELEAKKTNKRKKYAIQRNKEKREEFWGKFI